MFGLEVHCVLFIVKFPFALPICQHPKNFGIIGGFVEHIIGFGVNRLKVIIFIDILCTEVYQNPMYPDPLFVSLSDKDLNLNCYYLKEF